eukprot:7380854-Prymnesium_polylepis.1
MLRRPLSGAWGQREQAFVGAQLQIGIPCPVDIRSCGRFTHHPQICKQAIAAISPTIAKGTGVTA